MSSKCSVDLGGSHGGSQPRPRRPPARDSEGRGSGRLGGSGPQPPQAVLGEGPPRPHPAPLLHWGHQSGSSALLPSSSRRQSGGRGVGAEGRWRATPWGWPLPPGQSQAPPQGAGGPGTLHMGPGRPGLGAAASQGSTRGTCWGHRRERGEEGRKGGGTEPAVTLGQRAPCEMGEDRPQDTGMPPGRGVEAEAPDTVGRGALAPTSGPQMGQDPRDTVTAQPRCPCRDRGLAATRARASWGERGAPHSLLGRLVLDVRGPVYFGAQVGPGRQICVFQGTCDIFIGGASEEA